MTTLIPSDNKWMNRRPEESRIRNLIVIGMILTLMLLNVAAVFADNSTDLNASIPTQTPDSLNVTSEPTTLIPDSSFIIAEPAEVISAESPRFSSIINPPTVNGDYTYHAAKRITQEQKEAAAADYQSIREAYLLQGLSATGGNQINGDNLPVKDAVAFNASYLPAMDPGGVPHYFGPYANYANSPMPMGKIASITVDNGGTGYATAPTVSIADVYFTGSGATATATVAAGRITAITVTNPGTNYTAPVVIIGGPGTRAAATANLGGPFYSGMRKFVDSLPGLNSAGANNLGNYIPVAIPDRTTYFGSDYYEIELGEFSQQMHSDLPPTKFRGYRQVNTADTTVNRFMYLGPLIIANESRPVRVKFINSLPTGAGGNLFVPVDTTVMGAGMGPMGMNVTPAYYTQNRAELHLHGGTTPWISDGTPYQWITPAGEYTNYTQGVSVYNVPDMPDPGPGNQTYFYTNQQSARLMFYHDHAHGITRLNVYVGNAAGYLVADTVEQDMIEGTDVTGINTGINAKVLPDLGIPLIIQDKTWVDNRTIAAQDPTWNWGSNPGSPITGDLWYPHVYMPAQNPYDRTGVNAFGRWHYGPWFYPPTTIDHGPVTNPYYGQPGEPPMIPGTPNPSTPGEGFMDTWIVNGVAYPNLTVEPKAYRFRILNAANDRAMNLQLYVADPTVTTADGRNNTEVKMVPAVTTPGFPADWPTDNREGGVPDPTTMGPPFIQIGSEGGFLPEPVVVENQPITYVLDPTRFDVGNVDKHALVMMSAERADVIVDFSQYAGKTLILYNDAPAAYPAHVMQYNYYTGDPDRTSTGGAPTTQPGYGPNIRTVMQIHVTNTPPAAAYDVATLNAVFAKTATKRGVFEVSQPPIIIPAPAYSSAYNQVITADNAARINDHFKNFSTLTGSWINITFQPKALHDEMGGVYDQYGRMSGMLGLEVPSPTSVTAQFMPYGYASPPTDVIMTSLDEAGGVVAGDGTQIWKISHNGVDSHPLHWHMYNVQVINRVGWDGFIREPDPAELGWKETVRVSPLEDTIIALRPVTATVPFELPDQIRAIDPVTPLGAPIQGPPAGGWFDPMGIAITTNGANVVLNHMVNFGWEYVWHCHILAHEEMDMMHAQAISVNTPSFAPDTLESGEVTDATNTTAVYLVWTDRSTNETDWIVQRSNLTDNIWYDFKTVPSYTGPQTDGFAMAIDDSIPVDTNPPYQYRIEAANIVGDDFMYDRGIVFPTALRNTTPSGINATAPPRDPPNATFTLLPVAGVVPLNVSFQDTSSNVPTGWNWDFGDGNFASDNGQQHPYHVYQIPGTYTVRLTAMNTAGSNLSVDSATVTVSAAPPPTMPNASFTNVTPREGVAPFAVTFNADASISDPAVWATWKWTFGDGTFSSVKNPTHTYLSGGNYTVSLAAINLGGTNVTTMVGYVNVTAVPPIDKVGNYVDGVWRLDMDGSGTWNSGDRYSMFTAAGQTPVVGDWNGNGVTEIGSYTDGWWRLDMDGNGVWSAGDRKFWFGAPGRTPVVGDWNGDGTTEVGNYIDGVWRLDMDGSGTWNAGDRYSMFTAAGQTPVVGDWNGNGVTEIGTYADGWWRLDIDGNGVWSAGDRKFWFGAPGRTPVVGDWNGDGTTEVGNYLDGVWRLDMDGSGTWNAGDRYSMFTAAGQTPVVGDWNGDGVTEIGSYTDGWWRLDIDGNGVWSAGDRKFWFGAPGRTPVVGKW